jgi:aryl-alcohol dehydrogenase-like predicted oxidoreductase
VLPVCENHGIGVVGYSPLAEGLLTGKYAQRTPPDGTRASHDELNIYMREALSDRGTAQRIRRFVTVARDARMTPAQLALAVLLRRREVDSLIIGATTEAQLVENVKASGLRLEETTIDAVDELFPPKSYMSGS